MTRIEPVLDAYIDANIVLLLAFGVWHLVRTALARTAFGRDATLQLNLTQGLIAAAAVSPFLALALSQAMAALAPDRSLSLADMALAQFLNGKMQMSATQFEAMLGLRARAVEAMALAQSPVVLGIWAFLAAGFALSLMGVLRAALQLRALIGQSYAWRQFGALHLRLSDEISVPFSTRGLRRRYVLIPSALIADPAALRIVLAHELQHMRRWDTEWELALVLLRPWFFWNPAFGLWKRQLEHLRELSCDQALVQRGRVGARAYAHCLLDVARGSLTGPQQTIAVPRVPLLTLHRTLLGRRNARALRNRISAITAAPVRAGRLPLVPLVLGGAVMIALATASLQRSSDWSQDRLMLSTIVNLERLEARNASLSLAGF